MQKAKTRLRLKGYRMIDRICDDRKMTFKSSLDAKGANGGGLHNTTKGLY